MDARLTARVKTWRVDAAQFVQDTMGAKPSPQQAALLKAASKPGAHVAVKSGHGTGKSTVMAWLVLWALSCWDDVKVPCTAPTGHQLQDILWPEVDKWRSKMLEPWKSSIRVTKDMVTMQGLNSFAVARTGRKENPEALQGFHAKTLIFLVDEASGIDDKVFEVARGALSTPQARVIMAANPTRTTGYFYQAFHRARDNWDLITFSCLDSPHVAREYIKEMQDEYGEDSDIYRVRVLGEFPSGGDLQFISTALVETACRRYYRENEFNFAPKVLGVDVAWFGGDKSVVYLRQGLYARKLFSVQGYEPAALAGLVARLEDEHEADAVFVDATGIGAGVVSDLRLMGRQPIAVFLGSSDVTPGYANKRAECWGLMRQWLEREQGWIPDDVRLKDDLCGPEYSYNLSGKLILERKQDMKKRGVASPDDGDALALTFAEPITPRRSIRDMLEEVTEREERGSVFSYQQSVADKLFRWGR